MTKNNKLTSPDFPKTGQFTIMLTQGDSDKKNEKKQRSFFSEYSNLYYIGRESALLPFLTVKDNLFLGIDKKKRLIYSEKVYQWERFFKLDENISSMSPNSLTDETSILIHLIRALSQMNPIVLLDDVTLNISHDFLERLVPTLKKIAKEEGIAILLLTADEKVVVTHSDVSKIDLPRK